MATLRKMGYIVCFYLDDGWQKGDTYDEFLAGCQATYNLLLELNFLPNDKNHPLFHYNILRFLVTSSTQWKWQCLYLNIKKKKILALCHHLLDSDSCWIWFLAKVIGSLVSCFHICPLGQLHCCSMQRLKISGLTKKRFNWDVKIHITSAVKSNLKWWITHLPGSTAPIQLTNPTTILNTDLSGYVWGSYIDGIKGQGMFSENEMKLSIN